MLKIGVVGLGKLGLPLALVMAQNPTNTVVGFDVDLTRVKDLQGKKYNGAEPYVSEFLNSNYPNLIFTDNIADLAQMEIAYLIVPTPSSIDGAFENNFLLSAIDEIGRAWRNEKESKVLVIVSTVMPGSTGGELKERLEKATLRSCGDKLSLIYSPEFIALGSVVTNLLNPDVILIGHEHKWALDKHLAATSSYLSNVPKVIALNFKEAELAKILLNTYITMKISFANFIGELAIQDTGINAEAIADAVSSDSRVGSKYFRPGLGYGGPCFPRDNRALISYTKGIGISADLAVATDIINLRTPENIAMDIVRRFPDVVSVGVYGLTYKMHSEVTEESQSIMLANELIQHDLAVMTFDPILMDRPPKLNPRVHFEKDFERFIQVDLIINATGAVDPEAKLPVTVTMISI
jgi:UDPglucose 6-dehydrogenase